MHFPMIFGAIVIVIGVARLFIEAPQPNRIGGNDAVEWANCLDETIIPENTPVSLRLLPVDVTSLARPVAERLAFETDQPHELDAPDPSLGNPPKEPGNRMIPEGFPIEAQSGKFVCARDRWR